MSDPSLDEIADNPALLRDLDVRELLALSQRVTALGAAIAARAAEISRAMAAPAQPAIKH